MANRRWILIVAILLLAPSAPVCAAWSPLGGTGEPEIEVQLDPARPGLLYARVIASIGEGYLWRSEDGGETWRNVQGGLERPSSALAIDPADPKVIWVWTADGELWRSGDAGGTWSRRFATPADQDRPQVFQLHADGHDPATVWRVQSDSDTGAQVAVSKDGGESFRLGASVPRSSGPGSIFPHPVRGELLSFDEKGLEVSADDGQTWTLRSAYAETHTDKGFAAGRLAPSAPDTLYAVPSDPQECLARSDDAGAHWVSLPRPPPLPTDSARCDDVAVDPLDAQHIWVVAEISTETFEVPVFESRDGGHTWLPPTFPPGWGVVAAGGNVVYTARGYGLYVSQDGGRTWQPKHAGIFTGDLRGGFVAQRLPEGGVGRRLVALDTEIGGGPIGLFRSDGGRDWVRIPLADPYSVIDAGYPALLAVTGQGVFRSRNGGATWSVVPSAPQGSFRFQSDVTQPHYVAAEAFKDIGLYGRVAFWTSDNGGVTWRQSSQGLPLACKPFATDWCPFFWAYTVDPFDPKRRWVIGPDVPFGPFQLFVSGDSGASWRAVIKHTPWIVVLAADPGAKGRLLAGTYDGLIVSEDGGRHWRSLGDGLPAGAEVRQLLRDPRSATWYAATAQQGIYRSLDNGATWTLLEGAPEHDAPTIAVDPRRPTALLAAFRGQGIWRWTP